MHRALIAIEDRLLNDVVKTAFKQSSAIMAHPVPRERLVELVQDPDYHAVVLDLDGAKKSEVDLAGAVRATNPEIEILALMDREQKERFNRLKVDLGLFAYVLLPLDPFELARRVLRLEKHLEQKFPVPK